MKSKAQLIVYTIDSIPFALFEKVNVKNITEWVSFMYENDIFEMRDIYIYLDHKLKEFED
jgi:hypothetical protein